jgi:hypothetical protein
MCVELREAICTSHSTVAAADDDDKEEEGWLPQEIAVDQSHRQPTTFFTFELSKADSSQLLLLLLA